MIFVIFRDFVVYVAKPQSMFGTACGGVDCI
jgi:hypothetical protein